MPRIAELTAAGFTYEHAENAVWQVVADAVTSGAAPHIASRNLMTDPASVTLPVAGAECLHSVESPGRVVSVWRAPTGLVTVTAWTDGDVNVRAYAATADSARALADQHANSYPQPPAVADNGDVRMRFWFASAFGPESRVRRLACPTWTEVAANYPAAVRTQLDALAALDPTEDMAGRLILWSGPPGGGKSYGLRALAREWSPWLDVAYITDPDELLTDAGYLTTLLTDASDDGRWRLIIMEDSGEFVGEDARARSGAGLGRLLNAADGLLGQGTRTMFLLTTNEPITGLHPALSRPGRCLAAVEFGAFPEDEATAWLGAPAGGSLTLAEMWERRRTAAVPVAASAARRKATAMTTWRIEPLANNRCRVVRPDGKSRVVSGPTPEDARVAAMTLLASAARGELVAAVGDDTDRQPFAMVMGFLGAETSDGRLFGAGRFRTFPEPFMFQPANDDYHLGSVLTGRIDRAEILPGDPGMAARVIGFGSYDMRIPEAEQALLALDNGMFGVSWDAAAPDGVDYQCMEWDSDGWCDRARVFFPTVEIAGATQLGFPAFPATRVVLGSEVPDGQMPLALPPPPEPMPDMEEWDEPAPADDDGPTVIVIAAADHGCGGTCGGTSDGCACSTATAVGQPGPIITPSDDIPEALTAAAPVAVITETPPTEWFAQPDLDRPTPLVVSNSGRVYGHIAAWGTCHVGIDGRCVTPEDVRGDGTYSAFRLSRPFGEDGPATGAMTYGGGHAPLGIDARTAMAHYDDVTTAWADVVVGDDRHGIWVAGCARGPVMRDAETLRTIRGSLPSGDWRSINSSTELIAILQVNTPGFPIRQPELVASAAGEVLALVGYGVEPLAEVRRRPWMDPVRRLEERLARVERAYSPLLDAAGDALVASIQ